MIFTRDFVTRENYWQIASLVTQKSLLTVTHALFFIYFTSNKGVVFYSLCAKWFSLGYDWRIKSRKLHWQTHFTYLFNTNPFSNLNRLETSCRFSQWEKMLYVGWFFFGKDPVHHQKSGPWGRRPVNYPWWLALYAGNSPVTGELPAQRPVTQSFDFFLWSAPA